MDFKKLLEEDHSKKTTDLIVKEVCRYPKTMDELVEILLHGEKEIARRAAWPFSFVIRKKPSLLTEYYSEILKELHKDSNHDAITRNILRALQYVDIPEKYQGRVLNRAFVLLNDNCQPIAVRVFSMTVVFNLSKKYPDIIPELKASIESIMPNAGPGLKSRGNKILNAIG